MKTQESGMLNGILYALRHAGQWNKWVVVVTPEGEMFERGQRHFAAAATPDRFSGRTALSGKRGKVSLVHAAADPPTPPGTDYSVLFLGWGSRNAAKTASAMKEWRDSAAEVLSLVAG
jgi:hypothetical protein